MEWTTEGPIEPNAEQPINPADAYDVRTPPDVPWAEFDRVMSELDLAEYWLAKIAEDMGRPLSSVYGYSELADTINSLAEHICTVCKGDNEEWLACSDCRIDLQTTVYVCSSTTCRDEHEQVCPAKLIERIQELRYKLYGGGGACGF